MMKKQLCLFLLAGGITFLSFAEGIAQEAERGNERADYSYAFGMVIAADLEQLGMKFNYDAFMRGFREFSENLDTRYTLDEAVERIQTAFDAAQEAQAESNRRIEAEFLAQNASKPGVFTTSSGLQYEIITEGTGRQPAETDTVKVHYRGLLADGTVFDSSLDRGEPEEFPLPGVIPGWSEGIQLMREGGRSRFFIPSELAYGSQGTGAIPPASLLIFEVELLEILDTPLPEESELPGREE